jgi:hypothetical protein
VGVAVGVLMGVAVGVAVGVSVLVGVAEGVRVVGAAGVEVKVGRGGPPGVTLATMKRAVWRPASQWGH